MPGIFPETVSGGIIYRSTAGACNVPAQVSNAYCPDVAFTTNCDLTALPNDCTARIAPAQVNAIVSELLGLAECMDPTGLWDCTALTNLCTAFKVWEAALAAAGDPPSTDIGNLIIQGTDGNHYLGTQQLCDAGDALAQCLLSLDAANILGIGADGRLYVPEPPLQTPVAIAEAICADVDARNALALCMVSTQPTNTLVTSGDDGRLFVPPPVIPAFPTPQAIVNAICADDVAADHQAQCLVSTDLSNNLGIGSDGRLYAIPAGSGSGDGSTITLGAPYATIPGGLVSQICGNDAAGDALAACLRSLDAGNELVIGTDGRLYVRPIDAHQAGDIVWLTRNNIPVGRRLLKMNGASLATATYAALFAAIGYTFGGAGANFNVPDARGEFIRGWDDGRGLDPARAFGSAQADLFGAHGHPGSVTNIEPSHQHTVNALLTTGGTTAGVVRTATGASGSGAAFPTSFGGSHDHILTIASAGGTETRPHNLAFLGCIVY